MATTTKETTQRSDAKKIQPGAFFSRHSFGTIVSKTPYQIMVRNLDGLEWGIDPNIVEREFSFSDQFETTKDVNRTDCIELLRQHGHTAMTVNFNKKPEPKDVAKLLQSGQGTSTEKQWVKAVSDAIAGEERTMVGYHTNQFDGHMRLHFNEAGKGPRLVDVRTINWLIVDLVKYVVS